MPTTLDPLTDATERFALGRPRLTVVDDGGQASSTRPFGLRFATDPQPVTDLDPAEWQLCPDRQVAIREDGTDILDMTMKTSGPGGDGSSGGGAEEWGPDHHADEDMPA